MNSINLDHEMEPQLEFSLRDHRHRLALRAHRADWWFQRMRSVVEHAAEWRAPRRVGRVS